MSWFSSVSTSVVSSYAFMHSPALFNSLSLLQIFLAMEASVFLVWRIYMATNNSIAIARMPHRQSMALWLRMSASIAIFLTQLTITIILTSLMRVMTKRPYFAWMGDLARIIIWHRPKNLATVVPDMMGRIASLPLALFPFAIWHAKIKEYADWEFVPTGCMKMPTWQISLPITSTINIATAPRPITALNASRKPKCVAYMTASMGACAW